MIPRIRSQKQQKQAKSFNHELLCSIATRKQMSQEETVPLSPGENAKVMGRRLPNGNAAPLMSVVEEAQQQEYSPTDPDQSGSTSPGGILRINVGGRRALLTLATVRQRFDRSKLAMFCEKTHIQRLTECDAFLDSTDEYYFEKSPTIFEYVVDYYVTGKLHRPTEVCPIRLRDELDFWRIPLTALSECCKFDDIFGAIATGVKRQPTLDPFPMNNDQVYLESTCPPAEFDGICLAKLRLIVWTFLENPRSSVPAKVLSIASAVFVLLSLSGLILNSMPEFQTGDGMTPVLWLQFLEVSCMLFFTIEYALRLAVNPHKWQFIKQPLNIIDLLTIVPFYVEACLPILGIYDVELRNLRGALIVIRVMRLARVARIFKLARYSIGLRAFGETMRKSAAELSMLGMFLLTGIMLFSTAIYFFERDEPNSKFYSIPASWWWCVATMTTVGYGDLVPVTTGGKVVAAMASVCGIIVLAFPISMIIDKFAESTGAFRSGGSRLLLDNNSGASGPMLSGVNIASSLPSTVSSPQRPTIRRARSRRYLF